MQAPKPQTGNYELAPAGNHVARLYRIINIGTLEEEYMGKMKMTPKILLTFELCNELKEFKEGDGAKPLSVSREFTFSMAEKANLRKLVEGLLGVAMTDEEAYAFDVETLIGKPCLLNVMHRKSQAGKMYTFIQGASPLPKGMEAPSMYNGKIIFGHGTDWNIELFESMPDYLKEKIKASVEYKTKMGIDSPENVSEISPDDIPF